MPHNDVFVLFDGPSSKPSWIYLDGDLSLQNKNISLSHYGPDAEVRKDHNSCGTISSTSRKEKSNVFRATNRSKSVKFCSPADPYQP